MRRIWVSLIAAGLLAIAALAPVSAQDAITLDLEEVDGSGVAGNVRIESQDGEATVTILLTQGLEDASVHPVHIHEGTCEDLGDVAYPLNNIEDGSSETTIDVDLADLRTGAFAINAHESEDNIENFIACANIPAAVGGDVEDDDSDSGDDAAEDDASDESGDDQTADEGDDQSGDSEDGTDEGESGDDASADDDEGTDEGSEDAEEGTEDDGESADDASGDDEADDSEEQAEEDDGSMEDGDDEEQTQDSIAPETGSTGGVDSDTAAMALMLLAGTGLGVGMLLRRRATQPKRS